MECSASGMLKESPVRALIFLVLFGVMLGGGLWWATHQPVPGATVRLPLAPTASAEDVEWRFNKVRIHGVSGGHVVWEVEADHFDLSKTLPMLRISGLRKVLVLNEHTPELTLTAETLERNTASGEMRLQGGIKVRGKGFAISTASAEWDPRRERLVFPLPLTATIGDLHVTTTGVTELAMATVSLSCRGATRLTTGGSTLTSQQAEIALREQQFTLSNAQAEMPVAELTDYLVAGRAPALPAIPPSIRQRYEDYCRRRQPLGSSY
jgi:hypothetical protein